MLYQVHFFYKHACTSIFTDNGYTFYMQILETDVEIAQPSQYQCNGTPPNVVLCFLQRLLFAGEAKRSRRWMLLAMLC